MTLDIRGGLKNTKISSNRYVVIEELLSNAIDSYLIRKSYERNVPALSITFDLEFFKTTLFDDGGYDLNLTCTDNGAGFGVEQIRAFVTKDTSYKDYLEIQGIGKCKGAGRIQFFHYFRNLSIESFYKLDGIHKSCRLEVNEDEREVSEGDFKVSDSYEKVIETKVKLFGLKEEAYEKHFDPRAFRHEFSAVSLRKYIFVAFLQRFIVLKKMVGEFSIIIREYDASEGTSKQESIESSDLPDPTSVDEVGLTCSHGKENLSTATTLKITRYSLPQEKFPESNNEVALCANSALVQSIVKRYLKRPYERQKSIDGRFELLLIEGDLLEEKVNEQRDGFNIPKECSLNEEFEETFSIQDIMESIDDYVFGILTPRDFDKEALIDSTQERFGISRTMLNSANIKVHYGDTEDNIAKRVLKKYQEDIVKETSDIFDLKQELLRLDPSGEDFREKVGSLSWKYTSTIKKMDMANLSQLVVRRSSMVEVLKYAVNSMLNCQKENQKRRENEKLIHNIFFPTGKDSNDDVDHDIWILNEEYHYFEHIASDKSLSKIPWNDREKLFDSDIDESLEKLFEKNNKEHHLKRPDIAIFNQEGSAIIIEFKAPDVELQEHIPDLIQYARLLSAKSHGKIKKIYGYLIGDSMDETRMPGAYTKFPSGMGYFHTDPISDPNTGFQYGELYSEILFYEHFIDRAEKRLKIYKDKINVDI